MFLAHNILQKSIISSGLSPPLITAVIKQVTGVISICPAQLCSLSATHCQVGEWQCAIYQLEKDCFIYQKDNWIPLKQIFFSFCLLCIELHKQSASTSSVSFVSQVKSLWNWKNKKINYTCAYCKQATKHSFSHCIENTHQVIYHNQPIHYSTWMKLN